jgi:cytochrome c5
MWATIIVAIVLIAIIYPLTDRKFKSAADSSRPAAIKPICAFSRLPNLNCQGRRSRCSGPKDGATIYNSVCGACHNTGVAGAPKPDDKAAWAPRLATGKEALYKSAIGGKGAMPPKGGAADLSDAEIKAPWIT